MLRGGGSKTSPRVRGWVRAFLGTGPAGAEVLTEVSAAMCSGWDFAWVCQILGIIPGRSVSSRLRKAAPRESRALY